MNEPYIQDEASGVFIGILQEDMIETVKTTKKLYCNVWIPEFYTKDSDYPLTYVPLWAFSLPLRKGDKVLVRFNQDNLMYPILYKNQSELEDTFFKQFDVAKSVDGGNIQAYTTEDSVGVQKIGVDSYIIKTEDYTIIRQNNGFILIDKDDKMYVYGSEINVISSGTVNIDSAQNIQVYTGASCNIKTKSNCKIESTGSCEITANGGFTVNNHLKVNS